MAFQAVTLEDKYALTQGRVFVTGTQALVRLALLQRKRDLAVGLNTAGFITGYRGSPLGSVDKEFWRAERDVKAHHIRFQAGVNEDLAATAVWGSQQLNLSPGARYDGVFAMWYGKGPGVDRSGDAFRHANLAGTAPYGGVLAMVGDDPSGKSSTIPSQSEYALIDARIPILNPANVQELLDFGLTGWAMSRFSGCWVAIKAVSDTIDSGASVPADLDRLSFVRPADFAPPAGGLGIRWPDPADAQEARLELWKLPAVLAFARANRLDRIVFETPVPRLGIVASGKAYFDTLEALDALGLDRQAAARQGIRVYKVAMPWPLEPDGLRRFSESLQEMLVVEEKRPVIESQVKDQLFNWPADARPRVIGKRDERGEMLLPTAGELTPEMIAKVIAGRLQRMDGPDAFSEPLRRLAARETALAVARPNIKRIPYFCSGCPHNTSTRVPEGSKAAAGIGCHYMAIWMDRTTDTFTQMGGEGANWLGQAPFTDTRHIFVNIGDGTYFHSGLLAIRAAVASGANITYKVLYNDAVAMTGGQPVDGPLNVPMITRQVQAEGVERIAVVAETPEDYPIAAGFAPGTTIHPRDDFDSVQRELRQWPGVSILIFDQTCAAEKRRRRKRGRLADPARRPFINAAVCEGCGDCGRQSNCVSIVPLETEFGRKRAIEQSSCNKDFSCTKGFCPSFVTVHGGRLKKPRAAEHVPFPPLPEPARPATAVPYDIHITGIGGTGVVTVGAVLAMAAHIEGLGASVLDVAGLAQKNGAVFTHLRIADKPDDIHATRVATGSARLLLGCDMVAGASLESLSRLRRDFSKAVVNAHRTMTSDFTHDPDLRFPEDELRAAITGAVGTDAARFVDATGLATALLGDAIGANLFLVGYAYQQGLIPLSADAIERALELNGVAVAFNTEAFLWGRRAAHDGGAVTRLASRSMAPAEPAATTLEDIVAKRAQALVDYQDEALAERYRRMVARAARVEAERTPGRAGFAEAVARSYFKLLAYKDEYEVARLYTDGRFLADLERQFEGDFKLTFHLAPPLISRRDPETGELRKRDFGPWMMGIFRLLARLKGLRGTPFDPFGYTDERRRERQLIRAYEATLEALLAGLAAETHAAAVEIAGLPQSIRGFGHVKEKTIAAALDCEKRLLAGFREPAAARTAAA